MLPTKGNNTTAAAATADVDNNSDDAEHWSDERVEWAGITYSLYASRDTTRHDTHDTTLTTTLDTTRTAAHA
jgi:hypothetical protein